MVGGGEEEEEEPSLAALPPDVKLRIARALAARGPAQAAAVRGAGRAFAAACALPLGERAVAAAAAELVVSLAYSGLFAMIETSRVDPVEAAGAPPPLTPCQPLQAELAAGGLCSQLRDDPAGRHFGLHASRSLSLESLGVGLTYTCERVSAWFAHDAALPPADGRLAAGLAALLADSAGAVVAACRRRLMIRAYAHEQAAPAAADAAIAAASARLDALLLGAAGAQRWQRRYEREPLVRSLPLAAADELAAQQRLPDLYFAAATMLEVDAPPLCGPLLLALQAVRGGASSTTVRVVSPSANGGAWWDGSGSGFGYDGGGSYGAGSSGVYGGYS